MRKVLPRIINVITFIIALIAFLPNAVILALSQKLDELFNTTGTINTAFINFASSKAWYSIRILYIPLFFLVISIIYLIATGIDKKIKSHNNEASIAIELNTYYPLYFFGIFNCASGIIHSIFNIANKKLDKFTLFDQDYFGLGKYINLKLGKTLELNFILELLFYIVILTILFVLFRFCFKKNYKRNFVVRLLSLLLVFVFVFISIKGYYTYNIIETNINYLELLKFNYSNTFNPLSGIISNPTTQAFTNEIYSFIYTGLGIFILYLIYGIIRIIKNNKIINNSKLKESIEDDENDIFKPVNNVPTFEDLTKNIKDINNDESLLKVPNDEKIDSTIYNIKQPEEIIETVVEEKTVIKQVIFENSNLDKIFAYNFNFNNSSMVINNGAQDYFVNKIKFLNLSNNNRTMSFRLDLDRAIKLIIQYPLIMKDKYEDHKIWFKIDDITKLSNDVIIMIVKDAYNAVLNDD